MDNQDGQQLAEDGQLELDFERALKLLPHITILPKEWDCPEDDIYDEIYKDIGNDDDE